MFVSVIIRTYNESKYIAKVLNILSKQTYKNFEIIIVDSESTDNTLDIVRKFKNLNIKIISIKKKDFNYSYASNIGASNAKGDIFCFLSGHSVPVSKKYLENIVKIMSDFNVYGVYGDTIPHIKSGIYESLYYRIGHLKNLIFQNKNIIEKKIHPGILSCSNAAIKREAWNLSEFPNSLGSGGEDVYMAYIILKNQKILLKSNKMLVRHSHNKNIREFNLELKKWKNLYQNVVKYIRDENK